MIMADDDITVDADDAATRALAKLRTFIGTLPEDERTVLAALIAPGVASAYQDEPELERDVVGFGMTEAWRPERLPDALTTRIRSQHVRVEFERE